MKRKRVEAVKPTRTVLEFEGEELEFKLICACGSTDDVRKVRLRVPGKATAYRQDPDYFCPDCRKNRHGEFKYVN